MTKTIKHQEVLDFWFTEITPESWFKKMRILTQPSRHGLVELSLMRLLGGWIIGQIMPMAALP